jgi:hypothetical protein
MADQHTKHEPVGLVEMASDSVPNGTRSISGATMGCCPTLAGPSAGSLPGAGGATSSRGRGGGVGSERTPVGSPVRKERIPVEQDDLRTLTLVDVVHANVVDISEVMTKPVRVINRRVPPRTHCPLGTCRLSAYGSGAVARPGAGTVPRQRLLP